MLNEARQKESWRWEGEIERQVIRAMGRRTVKGGAEHSSTLEGRAISGPQLKTNTCLLTSPLSWLVKSQWNDVCIGTLPLPRSVSPSKLKALTGSDAGRVESWTTAKLEKMHRYWQFRAVTLVSGRKIVELNVECSLVPHI